MSLKVSHQPLLSNNKSRQLKGLENSQQNYGCICARHPSTTAAALNHLLSVASESKQYNGKNQGDNCFSEKNSNKNNKMKDKFNIKWIGVALFVAATIFCSYEIWNTWDEKKQGTKPYKTRLKLVNIFNRHGDRAPSDGLPKGDRHAEMVDFFWPNGLHNLTEAGKFREFKIGLETKRKYHNYLGLNSTNVLAFSSPVYRCQETLELILRGMYNVEWTKDKGRQIAWAKIGHNCTDCLPKGSGSAREWQKVLIDTKTLPSLTYEFLNKCTFRKKHPSPIDSDIMYSQEIRSLLGIEQLRDTLKKRYDQDLNFSSLGLWSTIASEMNIVRTESTFEYTNHYNDWVNRPVSVATKKRGQQHTKNHSEITLFDVYEQAAVLAYRDRIVDEANYIQTGPIVTSLIESQMVALGQNATNDRMQMYKDKKMILYSSHDSILQRLLFFLGIIHIESNFEARFGKWQKSKDEVGKFLSGLKMCSFGMSARFELYELELEGKTSGDRFSYVQVSIYNREEAEFQDIDYKLIPFGSTCRRLFKEKYPGGRVDTYYDPKFTIDEKHSCPFNLLRNLTASLMVDDTKLRQLCENNSS